jgi:hypothetical protein
MYNVAGAFSKFNVLSLFIMKNKIRNITVYDGINMCKWNGGRINTDNFYKDSQINFYYRHDINIALTFSNHIIDIHDKVGNELLQKFHRTGNKIILVNEDLRLHIRKNFPKYDIVHSITDTGKLSVVYDACIDYYKDLETKYDFIVPKMEHAMYLDDRLDLSKYEVMLNDSCVFNCSLYNEHFRKINEQNLLDNPQKELSKDERFCIEECWIKNFNPDIGDTKYYEEQGDMKGMDLTYKQTQILIDKGIKHFKISGREMTDEMFVTQLDIIKDINGHI